MTDRHGTEQTSRAPPLAAGSEPDLVVVTEYQRIELKRILKENQNLRGDIDRLLRLLERDQVIRQQEQQDRGALLAVMERLATERALPPPPTMAAPEAVEVDEAEAETRHMSGRAPDLGEDAPPVEAAESHFETSLSDLQEICDRLESVRAQAPAKGPNQTAETAHTAETVEAAQTAETAAPAEPAERAKSPDETASLSEKENLAALLKRLDGFGGADGESRPRRTGSFMTDVRDPGSSEARAKRVLSRLAALFERRP